MSPILTRPVREQLEHDRVIRLLQPRYKRKTEVIINPGSEQNQSVTVENLVVFPDLLIFAEGGKKLLATVEVETGESVNALEARAEWGVFCKLKVPMYLYVPPTSVDAARRLIAEYDIPVAEVWSFHTVFDQVRFTMIYRSPDAPVVKVSAPLKPAAKAKPDAATPKPIAKLVAMPPVRQAAGGQATKTVAKTVARPAAKPKPSTKAKLVTKAKLLTKAKPAAKPKPMVKAKAKPAAKAKSAAKMARPAAKKRR